MARAPWFKFYAGDYLNDPDVDRLTLEAQGVLVRMWAVAWIEGPLPSDIEELSRKCKVRISIMQLHMQELLAFFKRQKNGMYVSERMENERQRSMGVSKSRSKAANARWDKELNAFARATDCAKQNANADASDDAIRSQRSESVKILPPTPLAGGLEEEFQRLKELLKDDLSTSYANSRNFPECAYDRYFRDAFVVAETGGKIYISSPELDALREGLQKLGTRLSVTFEKVTGRRVAFEVAGDGQAENRCGRNNLLSTEFEETTSASLARI